MPARLVQFMRRPGRQFAGQKNSKNSAMPVDFWAINEYIVYRIQNKPKVFGGYGYG